MHKSFRNHKKHFEKYQNIRKHTQIIRTLYKTYMKITKAYEISDKQHTQIHEHDETHIKNTFTNNTQINEK